MSLPEVLTGGAADDLGQEVLDAIERALSAPEEVRILCAVTFLEPVRQVEEKLGRISELSNERKRDLAAHLSTIGLKKFQSDLSHPMVSSLLLRTSQRLRCRARMLFSPFH